MGAVLSVLRTASAKTLQGTKLAWTIIITQLFK